MSITTNPMDYLKVLTTQFSCRANGTQENKRAAEYLEQHFSQLGFDTTREYYPSVDWHVKGCNVLLGETPISAIANGYTLPCEIQAPFICVCSFEALEQIDCTNHILVLYGDLSKNELEAKPISDVPRYFPAEAKKLYESIENNPPLALVFIAHHDRTTSLHNDPCGTIPSLTVPLSAGRKLLDDEDNTLLSIHIEAARNETESWNVIARKQGKKPNKIILSAHFDTKFYCPGAYDNGSGVSLIMSLAAWIAQKEWEYTVEFIAFNSEEMGPISGDEVYLMKRGLSLLPFSVGMKVEAAEVFKDIIAVINFDRVGMVAGTDTIGALQATHAFKTFVKETKAHFPSIVYQKSLPCSNHYIFSSHGVPCIFCSSNEKVFTAHTADDTCDWISQRKLMDVRDLVYELVCTLMQTTNPLSLRVPSPSKQASARPQAKSAQHIAQDG